MGRGDLKRTSVNMNKKKILLIPRTRFLIDVRDKKNKTIQMKMSFDKSKKKKK